MRIARAVSLVLQTIMYTVIAMTVYIGNAHAASVYDDIVRVTDSVELQTSTNFCASSAPVDHTADWYSVVAQAISDYNDVHNNSILEWESDWNGRVAEAVVVVETNGQKVFRVLYSASSGENSFFSSHGNDYFAIYDPAPATPFRVVEITTEGSFYGNCSSSPVLAGASTGGQSFTEDNFSDGSHRIFHSSFPTIYPGGYEGEYLPVDASAPVQYLGTVDCMDPAAQPAYLLVTQAGNDGSAVLSYSSPARADWRFSLKNEPYQITVGCGNTVAASFGSVYPTLPAGGRDWMCNIYGNPPSCVLS